MKLQSKFAIFGAFCGLGLIGRGMLPAATAQDSGTMQTPDAPAPDKTKKPQKPKKQSPSAKPAKEKKSNKPVEVRRVLMFPPDLPSPAGISDQLTDDILRVVQRRLEATGNYYATPFLRSLPTVKRAVNEGTLTAGDTDRPFNIVKIKRLAQIGGYSMVFWPSVTSYAYDADKHQVTLGLSLSLYDYAGEKPIVRTAAEDLTVTGDASKTEVALALNTARDLTEKLMTELFKPRPITKEGDAPKAPDTPGENK